jgi:hypothetical protein
MRLQYPPVSIIDFEIWCPNHVVWRLPDFAEAPTNEFGKDDRYNSRRISRGLGSSVSRFRQQPFGNPLPQIQMDSGLLGALVSLEEGTLFPYHYAIQVMI